MIKLSRLNKIKFKYNVFNDTGGWPYTVDTNKIFTWINLIIKS